MKKSTKTIMFTTFLILAIVLDSFTDIVVGLVPAIGGYVSAVSNAMWGVIEGLLAFGLYKTSK